MVTPLKRTKYVLDYDYSTEEDDGSDNISSSRKDMNRTQKMKMKNKWLSKNAIMARENRLKKKLYVTNLEKEVEVLKTDNDNYTKVIESQSTLIADLRKEIKYLKSVIANSGDIGNLIRNIHHNTGMSVSTSLGQTLLLNNDYLSKQRQHIARKTAHPWEDPTNIPIFETESISNPLSENGLDFNDLFDFGNILEDPNSFNDTKEETDTSNEGTHLQEHNYTTVEDKDDDQEGGTFFGRISTIPSKTRLLKVNSVAVTLYFKAVNNMAGISRVYKCIVPTYCIYTDRCFYFLNALVTK